MKHLKILQSTVVKNRLDELFRSGKKNLLNIYCTAGYPTLESTGDIIKALQNNGADMIEIGMPYSDPIADGPVIQNSNKIALENGMDMHFLFEQLQMFKKEVRVPVILMGYLNPVLQFGIEKFCRTAAKAGVSGVIIPDLPMYEYEHFYRQHFIKNNLHFIFLVSPGSGKKRIKKSDRLGSGFLYALSVSATTGTTATGSLTPGYLADLPNMKLNNPVMIGFGIHDKAGFEKACTYARGAIIGSAYINALHNESDIEKDTKAFLDSILH